MSQKTRKNGETIADWKRLGRLENEMQFGILDESLEHKRNGRKTGEL